MPISILLLGATMLAVNFNLAETFFASLLIKKKALNVVLILSFFLSFMRPFFINDFIYLNLGGLLLTTSALFLLFKKKKLDFTNVFVVSSFLFGLCFFVNLLFSFMEGYFDYKIILISILFGMIVFLNTKTVLESFVCFFITSPLISLTLFFIEKKSSVYANLLLGTGTVFELCMIGFMTTLCLFLIGFYFKFKILFHKKAIIAKNKEEKV